MIDFTGFKMDLTFKESSTKIGKDFGFVGLDIFEIVNQVPYFELGLNSNFLEPIDKEKNIILDYQSDELNYEVPLGINSIIYDGSSIRIRGWMTEWENFKQYNTRYLGNNIKSAIEKLGIRSKINYDDNLSGDLFQINESNILQCLSLCQAGASVPYWSIGRTSINLNESNEIADSSAVITGGKLLLNTQDELEIRNEDTDWTTQNSLLNRYMMSDFDHKDIHSNYLLNKKKSDIGCKYYLNASTMYEYEYPIGTIIDNDNDLYPEVSKWVVTSCYYHYRANLCTTSIQYGGIING